METTRFEVTDYLDSEEAIEAYLADARACGEEGEIRDAEEVIARARLRWSLPAAGDAVAARRRAV